MPSVEQVIRESAATLQAADVYFGHGSDNAVDEAAELVFFALRLRHEDAVSVYSRSVSAAEHDRVAKLVRRRIEERVPAAYLTQRMWFCGHEFYVDDRVLVPRSPIAELIDRRFEPWIEATTIRRVLDIGTGSGCIAIASALALENVTVVATDISPDALTVADHNVVRHSLQERVRLVQSDVYAGLNDDRFDVIVSNPPYVGTEEVAALPHEYHREPVLGLLAGDDGLAIVRRILSGAEERLQPHGILVVEVGNTEETLIAAYPNVPFTWLEFERGGGGVFLLTAEQLADCRDEID